MKCGKCEAFNSYKMASSNPLVEQYITYFRRLDDNFDEDEGIVDIDLRISDDEKEITLRVMALSKELGYRCVDAAGVPRDCVKIYEGNEQFLQHIVMRSTMKETFPNGIPEYVIDDCRPKSKKRKAEQDEDQVKRIKQDKS